MANLSLDHQNCLNQSKSDKSDISFPPACVVVSQTKCSKHEQRAEESTGHSGQLQRGSVRLSQCGSQKLDDMCLITPQFRFLSPSFSAFSYFLVLLWTSLRKYTWFLPQSSWDMSPFSHFIVPERVSWSPLFLWWHPWPQPCLAAPSPKTLHGKVSRYDLELAVMGREAQFPDFAVITGNLGSSCFLHRLSAGLSTFIH